MSIKTYKGTFWYTFEEMGQTDLQVWFEFDLTPGTHGDPEEISDIKITAVENEEGYEVDFRNVAVKSKNSTWVSLEAELTEAAGDHVGDADMEVPDNA